MNAIQMKERADFYMDVTRNARFSFLDYAKAFNDAIAKYIDDLFGDIDAKNVHGFQRVQQIRDSLYTIIKTGTPTVTTGSTITGRYNSTIPNHINMPADYYYFVALQTLIGGYTDFARPISYNDVIVALNDSFRAPSNIQPYYNEDATGITIYRGATGTLTTATLTYIKTPATFSIGTEANLINAGAGVLTNATSYIAVETSVHNSVTYNPGTQFTSANTNLTSGQVILASNTTTCDLPEMTHEQISKMAAAIMSGAVSDYNRLQFVEKEVKEV